MPVLGMGGLFFRAKDPDALSAWYREHLGVGGTGGDWYWRMEAGPMVFAPFAADTEYFAADKAFMLNLRVSDLDTMIDTLNASGIAVTTNPEWNAPETGQFARLHDPEGNAIELWEPPVE